jgi:predicted RNA-binding protein with PIN domain
VIFLVDGSNLLGRFGEERESDDAKRRLLQSIVRFTRHSRSKATLFFDGPEVIPFTKSVGGVGVVFAGRAKADDLIIERVEKSPGVMLTVVTSDRRLAERVRGRRVEILDPRLFQSRLDSVRDESGTEPGEADWELYFSDPKNRNI